MTTATAKRTDLQIADGADILEILREQYWLWGCGMPRGDYHDWLRMQLRQPWARRNFRYFVRRHKDKIVASAKLYTLQAQARGVQYKVGGVGAVYTMQQHRGRGHGSELMDSIRQLAEAEGFDALMLFSDIDPSFYEHLGYEQLSHHDFYLWTNQPEIEKYIMSDQSFVEDLHEHTPELCFPDPADVDGMVRHHMRYLSGLPFGIRRSEAYWQYKLLREQFLQQHPDTNRPYLEMMAIDIDLPSGGYALFEHAGKILRVLEVVGREETREVLWRNLLRAALLRRVHLVRGWESVAPAFMKGVKYVERDGAVPMLLPLTDALETWAERVPCPLLELDHF
ncbi:MAG TPA: GNAT family N-acetyltransferase [Candidatus Obscuribacterales bacterium]